jgi:hypothetical protein
VEGKLTLVFNNLDVPCSALSGGKSFFGFHFVHVSFCVLLTVRVSSPEYKTAWFKKVGTKSLVQKASTKKPGTTVQYKIRHRFWKHF